MTDEPKDVTAIHGGKVPAEQVLRKAIRYGLEDVVVVGWLEEPDEDGRKFYLASSYSTYEAVIYALVMAQDHIVCMAKG